MSGPPKDQLGYYGLVVKPTFEQAVDMAKKPLRIPMPDRSARREATSLWRQNLLEQQRTAMGYHLASMEHAVSDEIVPGAVIHVTPSPSADDAIWEEIAKGAQRHYETLVERAYRHQVDTEAAAQIGHERRSYLSETYGRFQGNAILQGEVPVEELQMVTQETPARGHLAQTQIHRGAPLNAPISYGYSPHVELPTQRELNMGQARLQGTAGGQNLLKTGDSYESMRSASGRV
jgi:hypothetical protein